VESLKPAFTSRFKYGKKQWAKDILLLHVKDGSSRIKKLNNMFSMYGSNSIQTSVEGIHRKLHTKANITRKKSGYSPN